MTAGVSSGDVIGGRWRLGDRLGQGAFGQVFRADDGSTLGLGAAAVKVMHPSTSPAERANFHEEIRKVVAMRHPNLVAYLDSGEYVDDQGSAHLYLVTELCRYSLSDYLASQPEGRLSADQTERLLADMAAGLGYLHSRGLLHRDLKPANVLLGGSDWKLGDFGLTRELSATGHYHHGDTLMGTPRFMAPELFENGVASPPSDIYGVGVTLHQALTGRLVHEASNDIALIVQITTTPPTIDPGLAPHWRHLVERCLERDPARRPGASQLPGVLAERRHPAPTPIQPGAGGATAMAPGAPSVTGSGGGMDAVTGEVAAFPGPVAGPSRAGPSRTLLLGAAAALAVLALATVALAVRSRGGDTTSDDTAATETVLTGSPGGATADLSAPNGSVTKDSTTNSSASNGTLAGGTDSSSSTTAAAPVDTRPPAERIAAIIPDPVDAPAGYSVLEAPPLSAELCAGVQPLLGAHPGAASGGIEYSAAAQIFLLRGAVHSSVAAAEAAFDYASGLYNRCNGQPLDTGGSEVWRMTPDADVALAGADEVVAVIYETVGGLPGTGLLTIHARVGDVTVQSAGSDRAVTVYYAALMVARARLGSDPPKVEPVGDVGSVVAGNAGKIRAALAALGPGLRPRVDAWARGHTNDDIDTVVSGACAALAGADTPDQAGTGLVAAHAALRPELKGDLTSDDYAQLVGAGAVFYCPDEIERLGLP